jgi:hypothetical protein
VKSFFEPTMLTLTASKAFSPPVALRSLGTPCRNRDNRVLEETDCDFVVVHSECVEDICAASDYDKPKAHRGVVENKLVLR